MKWLIILLILAALIAYLLFRYRQQIRAGWQIWRMFRQIKQAGSNRAQTAENRIDALTESRLVRCERCGTWISPDSALKLPQKKFYCSSACVERAARLQSLVD